MVEFIFALGLMNFLLGYGLALGLLEPPFAPLRSSSFFSTGWKSLNQKWRWKKLPPVTTSPDDALDDAFITPSTPLPPVTAHDISAEWRTRLASAGILPESFLEAALEWLRWQVGQYHQQLIAAEARAKQAQALVNTSELTQLAEDLMFINGQWLAEQMVTAHVLQKHAGRLESHEPLAQKLEVLLWDHCAQLESMGQQIAALELTRDADFGARLLITEILRLADLSYHLRDDLWVMLLETMQSQQQLPRLEKSRRIDPGTSALHYLGLGAELAEQPLLPPFPGFVSQACLMEINGLRQVHDRLGIKAGDRVLRSVVQRLQELLAKRLESQVLARLAGSRWLLAFSSPTVDAAQELVEFLRQSLEATTFRYQGTELVLSLSCGAAEVPADISLPQLDEKLRPLLREARLRGRNCTAIWRNDRATLLPPPPLAIASRLVEVAEVG